MKSHLEAQQRSGEMVLWSDEMKNYFCLGTKHKVWCNHLSIPTINHGGGRFMLWVCFSLTGTENKMDEAK